MRKIVIAYRTPCNYCPFKVKTGRLRDTVPARTCAPGKYCTFHARSNFAYISIRCAYKIMREAGKGKESRRTFDHGNITMESYVQLFSKQSVF